MVNGFLCSVCGQIHPPAPTSYSIRAPDAYIAIPDEERASRAQISAEQCILDERQFFLRGRIVLPILDQQNQPAPELLDPRSGPAPEIRLEAPYFAYGCWVEVSPKNFFRAHELWKTTGRENEPPFPGYLANELHHYPRTLGLEVLVATQPVGRRPHLTVLDQTHPLAQEQATGITAERIQRIAEQILHHPFTNPGASKYF